MLQILFRRSDGGNSEVLHEIVQHIGRNERRQRGAKADIAVSGKHFAVGVDVDAFALGLLQQQLQVVEVMSGDDDERPLSTVRGTVTGVGVP